MKVLLHGPHKGDYIYKGFEKLVGERNVVSYLPAQFVLSYPELKSQKKYDILDTTKICDNLDRFDLIVFSQRSCLDPKFDCILKANTSATKIFVDYEDDFFVRNIYKHKEIKYYFKRELYNRMPFSFAAEWYARYFYGEYFFMSLHNKLNLSNGLKWEFLPYKIAVSKPEFVKLMPFPLSVDTVKLKSRYDRDIDLFFSMSLHRLQERHTYYKYLNKTKSEYEDRNIEIGKGEFTRDEYLNKLAHSKASVSLRGMGYDCDRYWEIPGYGAMLLSQKIPLTIPNNFVDGESALFFKNYEELQHKFEKYVVKSDEWIDIARKGKIRFLKFHTPEMRVKNQILRYLD